MATGNAKARILSCSDKWNPGVMSHTRCDHLKRNIGKLSDFKITLLRSSGAVFSHDEKAKNEYLTVQIIPTA